MQWIANHNLRGPLTPRGFLFLFFFIIVFNILFFIFFASLGRFLFLLLFFFSLPQIVRLSVPFIFHSTTTPARKRSRFEQRARWSPVFRWAHLLEASHRRSTIHARDRQLRSCDDCHEHDYRLPAGPSRYHSTTTAETLRLHNGAIRDGRASHR